MSTTRWTRYEWLALAATLLCTALLVVDIQRPSYWLDEKISIDIASPDDPRQVIANVIDGERRPPGYHLSLWIWTRLTGVHERTARLHSAIWAIMIIPATYQLTRRFTTRRAAIYAACFAALAQVIIGYGQTVRYYTMVATLSALSFTLFFDVMRLRHRKPWAGYVAVTLLLLYTDYPAYGVVLGQNILVLVWWIKRDVLYRPCKSWILAQAGLGATAALWLPVLFLQGARDFGAADLSHSLIGSVLRVGYPFYAWLVGETLFPWTVLAISGALAALIVLCIGFVRLQGQHKLTWLVIFGTPFIVAQVMLSTAATDSPFVNAPARSMACAALVFVLQGEGLAQCHSRRIMGLVLPFLLISHVAGLINYYRGDNYINTVYNTPAREVAQSIASRARTGDVIVTESDSMVEHYLPPALLAAHFRPDQRDEIGTYALRHPDAAIWQVTMGRDRTRNDVSTNLAALLATRYELRATQGFAEQDATYRALKSRLVRREAYRYRLMLDEYQLR